MNFDHVFESATRDHKTLLEVDFTNQVEKQKAFGALKTSHDALTRDVSQCAFQGGRSKRKQWGDVQKELAELLDEGRSVVEAEEAKGADLPEKVERRYQRLHSRIVRLAEM